MSENTSFFDEALAERISYAVGAARAIGDLDHKGLKGSFREMILGEILEPLLPGTCGVYHGTVISSYPSARRKTEDDVLIVDRECLPPLLYSRRDGIFPIESVLARIEVKSVLKVEDLSSAVVGCREFSELEMNIMGDSGVAGQVENDTIQGIFAYCSRIGNELEYLRKYSDQTDPPFRFLCVVGKGMWMWGRKKPCEKNRWLFCRPDDRHSEIVSMLALMLDSLPPIRQQRKAAVFGNYILCLRSDRMESTSDM